MQVLIDADNLGAPRLRLLVAALAESPSATVMRAPVAAATVAAATVAAAGTPAALGTVDWPRHARLLPAHGWQSADLLLAGVYRADDEPLLLATGDGDFVHLARRHPGPVLLVGGWFSRSRGFTGPGITITDPADDGGARLRSWLRSNG